VEDPYAVAQALRSLPDALAFAGSVKARAVPIMIFFSTAAAASAFERNHSFPWCRSHHADYPSGRFDAAVQDLLAEWRQAPLDELDCVGFAVAEGRDGQMELRPAFRRRIVDGQIVTPVTCPSHLRRAGYLLLPRDLIEKAAPIRRFEWLLANCRAE